MKWNYGQAATDGPFTRRVHSHIMAGVDVPLTDVPGRDEMIKEVEYILQWAVHTEFLPPLSVKRGATIPFNFEISNTLTGHSVPSAAFFIRQMWVQISLTNENGDTLFASGMLDPNTDLLNGNSEFVKQGKLPRDSSLVMFNGAVYRHGEESSVFNADAFVNHSIPAGQTRYAKYRLTSQQYQSSSAITANVKLLMRALPPFLLRSIGHAELVSKVPIFTMEEKTAVVEIQ